MGETVVLFFKEKKIRALTFELPTTLYDCTTRRGLWWWLKTERELEWFMSGLMLCMGGIGGEVCRIFNLRMNCWVPVIEVCEFLCTPVWPLKIYSHVQHCARVLVGEECAERMRLKQLKHWKQRFVMGWEVWKCGVRMMALFFMREKTMAHRKPHAIRWRCHWMHCVLCECNKVENQIGCCLACGAFLLLRKNVNIVIIKKRTKEQNNRHFWSMNVGDVWF